MHMKYQVPGVYLLLILLLFTACYSGKKALQKGNYDLAVQQAVNRLRSGGSNKKAVTTLKAAYPFAIEAHRDNIKSASMSNDPFKWESIAQNYQSINYLHDEIYQCPSCRKVIPDPAKFDKELNEARLRAAEVRYQLGLAALEQKENREKAVEAHEHFSAAASLVPYYKDVEDRLQEALYYATLRVVIEPIPAPSRQFKLSHDFFVNKINEYLHQHEINTFVRFYTPEEAYAEELEYVDHVIQMEFDRFDMGNVFYEKTIKDVSKDSVVLEVRDSEKIYGTVKAKVTLHDKKITSSARLNFQIVQNATKKIISQERFSSEYTWSAQWGSFNGDERALDFEDRKLMKIKEPPVPDPQWMFEQLSVSLYDQIINQLRAYYRNV